VPGVAALYERQRPSDKSTAPGRLKAGVPGSQAALVQRTVSSDAGCSSWLPAERWGSAPDPSSGALARLWRFGFPLGATARPLGREAAPPHGTDARAAPAGWIERPPFMGFNVVRTP
jgi:hypothetical protein